MEVEREIKFFIRDKLGEKGVHPSVIFKFEEDKDVKHAIEKAAEEIWSEYITPKAEEAAENIISEFKGKLEKLKEII